jgi:predicted phage tail protein
MSNFDPRSPSYIPPGGGVVDDGTTYNIIQGNQTAQTILAAGTVLTASTSVAVDNFNCRGGLFTLDITTLPASASNTYALKILTVDPVGGRTVTLATRAAVAVSGVAALLVYPGISASVGGVASVLPRAFNVKVSISSGATNNSATMSLSFMRIL